MRADLTCLGKIIGGGLPVGAYGGKREIMEKVSPLGGVYQAGTLSGNPLAMTAGIATLNLIKSKKIYQDLAPPHPFTLEFTDHIPISLVQIQTHKWIVMDCRVRGDRMDILISSANETGGTLMAQSP